MDATAGLHLGFRRLGILTQAASPWNQHSTDVGFGRPPTTYNLLLAGTPLAYSLGLFIGGIGIQLFDI
ncbi:hypothetical protein pCPXV0237 [Cowpox virus]|uniref:Uncharacterized protein n=1 Tax=Cowpox virus TaxID=10243 RepID=A0A0K2YS90_COWPX|nr:hypothetical protein pCPXV0237 [Cowpox virus]SNB49194.1 hypothetical protein pCPXV0237 [Cowpox virus]SPN67836.1 hypothetical protein pCPXV0237 [Cowpox virus]